MAEHTTTTTTQPPSPITHAPLAARSWLVPTVLGVQAATLAGIAVGAFGGIAVGSTALRVGVGILFLVLAAGAAGIAISYSEGQPAAGTAALVFEGFAVGLGLLWFAPIPTLVAMLVGAVVLAVVLVPHQVRRQIRRPVPSQ
jgi:hypothetical protein